jgi:hypothetical protein
MAAGTARRRADAGQPAKDAASELDGAAKHDRCIANASDEQLREHNKAIPSKVRDAAENLSHAVAEQRPDYLNPYGHDPYISS